MTVIFKMTVTWVLVSQMLELHKSRAGAKTQSDADVREAERQIKAVDEAIDNLVYELYGLSPDEIKIIEGKE